MSSIDLRYGNPSVTISTSAFTVEGHSGGLSAVPTGHLVHLEQDALGLAAGYYQAGHYQGQPAQGQRTFYRVSDAEAAHDMKAGATVSAAAAAPDWPHPFAICVEGMRLSELRAFLATHPDLPDDTLVLIGPATHHLESEDAPAYPGLDAGAYVPAMNARGNYGAFWHPDHSDEPRPELSIPAVLLTPSV
ncbi:hypothetical protein ACFW2K_22690 [Streptomyces nigra]|uniref:Uncharacterized protein n=1 Tax=Streptomyces sp. FR1 TaxID=349971 RepID=V9Z621_9ACTN|nr:hypothetical protein [Streptomyces sp. FR1]AHE38816.1 hypothetical protein pFRL3_39 [Streptomyces sp. FR1]